MRILDYGNGVHQREIVGVEKLQSLPSDWYAYTNLDIVNAPGTNREIDVVLIAEDRIFLIDLKDWKGPTISQDGNWFNHGEDMGRSPVAKDLTASASAEYFTGCAPQQTRQRCKDHLAAYSGAGSAGSSNRYQRN